MLLSVHANKTICESILRSFLQGQAKGKTERKKSRMTKAGFLVSLSFYFYFVLTAVSHFTCIKGCPSGFFEVFQLISSGMFTVAAIERNDCKMRIL